MDERQDHESAPFFFVNLFLALLILLVVVAGGLTFLRYRMTLQARAAEAQQAAEAELRAVLVAEEAHRIKEQNRLAGDWLLAGGELAGQRFTPDQVQNGRLTFDGNRETIVVGSTRRQGTYQLHLTRTPHGIDAIDTEGPFQGETLLGVYELHGGQLSMSFAAPGEPRPADIKQGHLRYVWKRTRPQ